MLSRRMVYRKKHFKMQNGEQTRRRVSIRRKVGSQASRQLMLNLGDSMALAQNDTQSHRGKVLDGSFFEDMTVLEANQSSRVEKAYNSIKERNFDAEDVWSIDQSIFKPPEKEKALLLYKELVYTMKYQLGKRDQSGDSLSDGEIFGYGKQVFGISASEHKTIYDEVSKLKPPECYLNLKVIGAAGLDPKDANGFSDPYCMISVIDIGEGDVKDKSKKKKKVLRDFQKEEDIKLTKIKLKTLHPEWNQHFKFVVNDVKNQVLRVDIWDKDDNTVVWDSNNAITAIKGVKGAGRFLREMYQSARSPDSFLDDFMGLVEIPLKSLPEEGLDSWFQLEPQSEKKKANGKLHLKMSLSAKVSSKSTSIAHAVNKDFGNNSTLTSDQIYDEFLNYFVRYDCQRNIDFEPGKYWDGAIMDKAEIVLKQYCVQHEVSKLQQIVVQWKVYSYLCQKTLLSYKKLIDLLLIYSEESCLDELSEKENEDFLISLETFCNHGEHLLSKYRYIFSAGNPDKILQLTQLLMCLDKIHKLPVYANKFPHKQLSKRVADEIEKSTTEWFFLTEAFYQSVSQTPLDELKKLVQLTNTIIADLKIGASDYKPVFQIVEIDYNAVVFNKIELLLSEIVETCALKSEGELIAKGSQEFGTAMFELFIAVRHLHSFKKSIPQENTRKGGLDSYCDWFKKGVIKWLDIATLKAEQRIEKAVLIDEVRVIDSMVKHSTSAVDVTCCLGQICIFWKNLEWPDVSGAYMFLSQISGIIGKCAMDYAEMIFQKLKVKGFYDNEGQFDVTDQLCIMMNNMAHVLEFLNYVPEALEYEKVVKAMVIIHGEDRLEQLQATLKNIILCAQEDMDNKLEQIIKQVGRRVKESFSGYINKIIYQHKIEVSQAADPLLEYIDSNLVTLNMALLSGVFNKILLNFWEMFVASSIEIVEKDSNKLQACHYDRLIKLLPIVMEFFYGDGKGVSAESLTFDSYTKLIKLTNLNASSTEQLIEEYYVNMCEFQKTADSSLGQICFKIFYCNRTKTLNIYVMNCKKLLPMDTSGYSDPYVVLQLKPDHLFPKQSTKSTSIQKSTLFPLFDESFQFDIPHPDCLKNGATLLFTIYDKDRLDDDLSGEVFYGLQDLPGLHHDSVQGAFGSVPQIEMNLCVAPLIGDCVKVLNNRRPNDQLASTFLDKQKERHHKMSENVKRAKQQLQKIKK
ncbi:BAI1-associated protein 3 isoform X1 [Hydra vulgaris]|uniref:BAI1-associated protein 3 isoform X1 n=2 Tax=Hydra vulgaris TaxID=6087 RepID=UPI0032E9E49C